MLLCHFGSLEPSKDLVLDFKLRQELWKELWPECQRASGTTLCLSLI